VSKKQKNKNKKNGHVFFRSKKKEKREENAKIPGEHVASQKTRLILMMCVELFRGKKL